MKQRIFIVCMIILLAGFFTPGLSRGNQHRIEEANRAKRTLTRLFIRTLGRALKLYRLDTGRYPDTAQGLEALIRKPEGGIVPALWKGPYLDASKVPLDGWKHPFVYTFDFRGFEIISLGADGKKGGEGFNADISSKDF